MHWTHYTSSSLNETMSEEDNRVAGFCKLLKVTSWWRSLNFFSKIFVAGCKNLKRTTNGNYQASKHFRKIFFLHWPITTNRKCKRAHETFGLKASHQSNAGFGDDKLKCSGTKVSHNNELISIRSSPRQPLEIELLNLVDCPSRVNSLVNVVAIIRQRCAVGPITTKYGVTDMSRLVVADMTCSFFLVTLWGDKARQSQYSLLALPS